MSYLLTASGHQVVEAHDGPAAIGLARRERPDVILLDIHMPRMDGYEVARQLRSDAQCAQIPLVAVTALAMVGDREKILAAGFSGYVAKPLDPETFPTQVETYLEAAPQAVPRSPVRWEQQPVPVNTARQAKIATILLVDNIQANIDLGRSILEPSGYEVLEALSAPEGLDLARRTQPDLIVSDVHMRHQDGYEFLRMVQADPELSGIPLVFLSSSVFSVKEGERALSQGARKFISRPIEPQMLLEQLKDCILKPAPSRAAAIAHGDPKVVGKRE